MTILNSLHVLKRGSPQLISEKLHEEYASNEELNSSSRPQRFQTGSAGSTRERACELWLLGWVGPGIGAAPGPGGSPCWCPASRLRALLGEHAADSPWPAQAALVSADEATLSVMLGGISACSTPHARTGHPVVGLAVRNLETTSLERTPRPPPQTSLAAPELLGCSTSLDIVSHFLGFYLHRIL